MIVCFNARTKRFFLNIVFLAFIASCSKEEKSTGSNIVADRTPFDIRVSDTATLQVFTTRADSVNTSRLSLYMVGSINDPALGASAANLYTNVSLPVNQFSFGPNFSGIDSIVLQLVYGSTSAYYGTLGTEQRIKLFEMNEGLSASPDSTYFSNRIYNYGSTLLGEYNATFQNIDDSVTQIINGQTILLPPHIRIKITDQAFISRIANGEASGIFQNNQAFQNSLKGFAIISEGNPTTGEGCIAYLNLKSVSNVLSIYYNGTQQIGFPLSVNTTHANQYLHTYNLQIQSQLQPAFSSAHFNTNYVHAMTGLKTRIIIPHLYDYIKDKKIAIANAELEVSLAPSSDLNPFSAPQQLYLLDADNLGRNDFIRDFFEGAEYYGGKLNPTTKKYAFNINRHIQYLLNEYNNGRKPTNNGLNLIVPSDNPLIARRAILNTSPGAIKLKLTYTVVN
jgi:hypothetical protein